MADFSTLNSTDPSLPYAGWVSSSRDRGSIDILWSCCFTIFLCIWVATHPNAVAPHEGSLHRFLDKLRIAMFTLLGPDFLFGIAVGQFSSAWRSVKAFKRDRHLCKGAKWTLAHGFLADMGGIHLISPDFETGFPITAAQLHYLVLHGHLDFPDMEAMNIDERSTSDVLSRLLTMWQALWFSVTEFQRWKLGLPMTTLELTALSFVLLMIGSELCWLKKPSIAKPRSITTKDNKTIEQIRAYAKEFTHPDLSPEWYRTPLSFIEGKTFAFDNHWNYLNYFANALRIVPRGRMEMELWDRFPCDIWMPIEKVFWVPCTIMTVLFSLVFLVAWDNHFPTYTEQILWRVFSTYHACFSIIGGAYYTYTIVEWYREKDKKVVAPFEMSTIPRHHEAESSGTASSVGSRPSCSSESPPTDPEALQTESSSAKKTINWRNLDPSGDPSRAMKMKFIVFFGITSGLYILCRLYIYAEDFASLRELPVGVYITVNRFMPFVGN